MVSTLLMPNKFNASLHQTLAKKWGLVTNRSSCNESLRERGTVTVWLVSACVHTKGQSGALTKVLQRLGADTIAFLDAEGEGEITVRLPGHLRLKSSERPGLKSKLERILLFGHDGKHKVYLP